MGADIGSVEGCYRIAHDDVAWKVLDDEAVVIHSASAQYYGLNRSATVLWRCLVDGASAQTLSDILASRFVREPELAAAEAAEFIESARGWSLVVRDEAVSDSAVLLDREDSSAAERPDSAAVNGELYEPPRVVPFGDLATLVLSGE
jgi:hypothetical protein